MSSDKRLSPFLGGVTGMFAAMTAETITFPIDFVKTRLMLNGQDGTPQYNGIIDCVKRTYAGEGVRGFYKGAKAAVFRQTLYPLIKMTIYDFLNKTSASKDPKDQSLLKKVLIGVFAGGAGNFVATPTDLVKIRMVNDHRGERYSGLFDAFSKIYKEEGGFFALYKGCWPNSTRAAVVGAAQLATYDKFKYLLVENLSMDEKSKLAHFSASSLAGLVAAVVSNPVDVVKTRYMNQDARQEGKHMSSLQTISNIYRSDGLRAFYKGFWPNFGRLTPWNIAFFMSMEQYRNLTLKVLYQ